MREHNEKSDVVKTLELAATYASEECGSPSIGAELLDAAGYVDSHMVEQ